MDIDISDILADVSKQATQYSFSNNTRVSYDGTTAFTDHQQLVRCWTSERCAPDLLPYPTALITRVMSRISSQITRIEDLASDMSSDTSHHGTSTRIQNTNLTLSILQTDLSRTQFILRSYLRQRLAKLAQHAVYYLTRHVDAESQTSSSQLLSPAETAFVRNHQALLSEFYDSSFLAGFPAALRRLDDSSGGVSMVEGPDGGVGVVVRCLSETWGNDDEADGNSDDGGASVDLRMNRGEVYVVRWRDVRKGAIGGQLELL